MTNDDAHRGGVLADGTRLEDLIDRERRVVRARIHSDPEIHQLELEQVFARAWIPVAHVSELRRPGDFVTRTVGQDPVIVTLDSDGEHHVMLNACSHRGAQVCSADLGHARTHRCPFHRWTYGVDGKLLGVPQEQSMYGDGLDRDRLGLRKARVGVASGLVFATWDEGAPPLDEYIGDFAFYLDAMLCRTDAGMEVAGPPQRYVVDANWKVVVEGFFGDSYHVPSVHQSFTDIGAYSRRGESPFFKASINGHAAMSADYETMGITGPPEEVLAFMTPPGTPAELVGELSRNLTAEQMALLAQTPPSVSALFPSTAILQITTGPGSPVAPTISVRFFVPIGVEQTELVSFALVDRDASPEFKAQAHQGTIRGFGVAGMFEADDVEVWASVQRGVRGVIGRQLLESYQSVSEPVEDPIRPGEQKYRGTKGDDLQWHFYERYFDMLEGR